MAAFAYWPAWRDGAWDVDGDAGPALSEGHASIGDARAWIAERIADDEAAAREADADDLPAIEIREAA